MGLKQGLNLAADAAAYLRCVPVLLDSKAAQLSLAVLCDRKLRLTLP